MANTGRTVKLRTAAARSGKRAAPRPAPRWRAWVEALLGRYLRRPARPGGPERVLARPPGRPLSLVRERWLFASRTLLPQIHLAIQPLLRPRLWQGRPVLAAHRQGTDVRTERTLLERTRDARAVPETASTPPRPVFARLRETAAAGLMLPAIAAGAGASRSAAVPPLQLVFQRLREPERALGGSPVARATAGLAGRPQLARQLAGKGRRTEQPPAASPPRVVARREAPVMHASSEPPAAAWGSRAAPSRWSGPASAPPVGPQPAVNVEALADRVMQQIDHRLHAWRERTGF